MVDAGTARSRSRDSIETSRDESGHRKKKDQQRPKSVHETVNYDEKLADAAARNVDTKSAVPIQHKEVYYMEEILKEENGEVEDPEVAVEDFQEEDIDEVPTSQRRR